MLTRFLHADLAGFLSPMPSLDGCGLVATRIADYSSRLFSEERGELLNMVEQRVCAFSSGRHCAHLVQELLGQPQQAILRHQRAPLWPSHSVGSITHSHSIAASFASLRYSSVGIDLETDGRLTPELSQRVFTAAELQRLHDQGTTAASIMFSAKEAGYKAIYPLAGEYIGFMEAEIVLGEPVPESEADGQDNRGGTFTIEYIGDYLPNKALNSGHGYWSIHQQHVMTLFVIP